MGTRASAVIGIGLLLALAATLGPPPLTSGAPGASLSVRLPTAVQAAAVTLLAGSSVLLLALQRRRRPPEDPLAADAEARRSSWSAALSLLPLLVLTAALWYLVTHRADGETGDPIERAFSAIAGLLDLLALSRKPPTSVPLVDLTLATLVLLFALGVFALAVVVALAPRLEKWWTRGATVEASPTAPVDLADPPDDLRADPDPRAAIIRAYGRFEHALARARTPRLPCQTPAEFRRTVLSRVPLSSSPVTQLTTLFELARFSRRPLTTTARDTACDCLDQITTALAAAATTDTRAP
jgi:hypothetical protein